MDRFIRSFACTLLLLPAAHAYAEFTFAVTPSVGMATITNIDGYKDAGFLRVDGSFYPLPQVAANVFITKFGDFETNGGNDVSIGVDGGGVGAIGRWPLDPHFMPYLRGEYFLWNVKATGLNRTLAEDHGASIGLAIGAQFPIDRRFGIKTEFGGYNNVSGANLRQLSLGLVIEF